MLVAKELKYEGGEEQEVAISDSSPIGSPHATNSSYESHNRDENIRAKINAEYKSPPALARASMSTTNRQRVRLPKDIAGDDIGCGAAITSLPMVT
jgi:hypothetical protein